MSTSPTRWALVALGLLTVAALCLVGLQRLEQRSNLVIGSKNFTESRLLAALMAEAVEGQSGLTVQVRELGSTTLCFEALRTGAIDLYPEYTGTLLVDILQQPAIAAPGPALQAARELAASRYPMSVLDPFGFNNTYVLVMDSAEAARKGIRDISDLNGHPELRAGFTSEFNQRPDGYPGLARHYGLRFQSPPVDLAPGHMLAALARGQVQLASAFSTDYRIRQFNLAELRDDKLFFPDYQAVPLVRQEALERFPALLPALQRLGGCLDDPTMRELNRRVEQDGTPVGQVAQEFWLQLAVTAVP